MLWEWSFALMAVVVFLASGISLRLLGLYNPRGFVFPSGVIGGLTVGTLMGILFLAAVGTVVSGDKPIHRRPLDSDTPPYFN